MISSVLAEVQTKQLLNTATPTCLVLSVTDCMSVHYIIYRVWEQHCNISACIGTWLNSQLGVG